MGPGTILLRYLGSKKIKPVQGCSCYELAQEMDKVGPKPIREQIDYWTDLMVASIKDWRKFANRAWQKFVCPPRFVVKDLILWACDESEMILNGKEH